MKRILFLLAIVLAALGFLTTAMEVAARAVANAEHQALPVLMPLAQTLAVALPEGLAALQRSAVWTWLGPLMGVPGWVLFGIPGLLGILVFREHDPDAHDPELEESLFLYDELADAARRENLEGAPDDFTADSLDEFEPAEDHFAADLTEEEMEVTHDYLLTNQDERH